MEWVADRWLTQVTGIPCYNLQGDPGDFVSIPAVIGSEPAFYSAKASPLSLPLIHALEEDGFRLVDTNITFTRNNNGGFESSRVRIAVAGDKDRVKAIAATAFSFSRFHTDNMFTSETANRIKGQWAVNYFSGERGDCMFIVERANDVAGFLLAMQKGTTAIIDLIAVDENCRGQGCGTELVNKFMRHYAENCQHIVVGTQLANVESLGFYQSMGFRLASSDHVFHKHLGGDKA